MYECLINLESWWISFKPFYRTINYAVYWYSTVYWYRCGVARVGVFWVWPGFSREGARGRGQGSPGAYRGSASQYPPDNITIIHTVSHCSALRPVNWLRDAAWDCKSNKHNLFVNHLIKLELVSFSLETIYCNTLSGRLRRSSWTPGYVLLLCPHQSSTAAVSGVLQLK